MSAGQQQFKSGTRTMTQKWQKSSWTSEGLVIAVLTATRKRLIKMWLINLCSNCCRTRTTPNRSTRRRSSAASNNSFWTRDTRVSTSSQPVSLTDLWTPRSKSLQPTWISPRKCLRATKTRKNRLMWWAHRWTKATVWWVMHARRSKYHHSREMKRIASHRLSPQAKKKSNWLQENQKWTSMAIPTNKYLTISSRKSTTKIRN